ncbi:MAG: hypothetical protein EA416_11600, partial [Trueperaceae bacterium]
MFNTLSHVSGRFAVVAVVVAVWTLSVNVALARGMEGCETGVVETTGGPVCGNVVALDGLAEVQA